MIDIPKVDISQISIPDPINPKTNWGYQGINRIVIIGNGFDLVHGLPTQYEDFINWYKEQRVQELKSCHSNVSEDKLCRFEICGNFPTSFSKLFSQHGYSLYDFDDIISNTAFWRSQLSSLFNLIIKDIHTYKWVDIECEYYKLLKHYLAIDNTSRRDELIAELNEQLTCLKNKLIEYLSTIQVNEQMVIDKLKDKIYAPIEKREIAVNRLSTYYDHIQKWANADEESWENRYAMYEDAYYAIRQHTIDFAKGCLDLNAQDIDKRIFHTNNIKVPILWPDNILFLNFNYTPLGDIYTRTIDGISNVHIHGEISNPEHVIFGYGDEIDKTYQTLVDFNNNDYLENIKSIQYNDEDNYHKVLDFVESAPFQIYIMGHSSGISDRTLLNTLFEHKNCVSIKPFYHEFEDGADNYRDLVKNIFRNFTDMKLMRSLVVNKKYCETI